MFYVEEKIKFEEIRRRGISFGSLGPLLLNGDSVGWLLAVPGLGGRVRLLLSVRLLLTTWDHKRLLVDKTLRLVLVNNRGLNLVLAAEADAKGHAGANADDDANDDSHDDAHRKRCRGGH